MFRIFFELRSKRSTRGFTLIELLVVVAIISMLASIVMASLNSARAKARDSKRLGDFKQLQTALELYATDNGGKYPATPGPAGTCTGTTCWYAACDGNATWIVANRSTSGTNGWIPSLAPSYISVLPVDPRPWTNSCYLYRSDGTDYMLLAHWTVETAPILANNLAPRPGYDGLSSTCSDSNVYQTSFAVYTPGGQCW